MITDLVLSTGGEVSAGVDQFTSALNKYLIALCLPVDGVLVSVVERQRVLSNLPSVLDNIDINKKMDPFTCRSLLQLVGLAFLMLL